MPNTIRELKTRIRYKIPYLTEPQKTIANYIIENIQKFALSSIRELEEELNTSKSTIVRLSQALGYGGFQELKAAIVKSMRRDLDPNNRYQAFLSEPFDDSSHLKLVADEAVNNVNYTLRLMDSEQYWKAIKLLKNATHVHTMGLGISTYIAEIAAYLLKKIGIKSSAMCYGGFTFMQSIIDMPARDVILAFSFPPYSMDMIHAAAFAHKKGLKVIAVTNKVTSKIVQYSAVYLQIVVESTTVYNSMSTILTLLNALITDLADKLKLRSLKAIETAEVAEKDIHLGNTSVTGGKCHRERSVAISRGWQARQEIASSKTPRNDHP